MIIDLNGDLVTPADARLDPFDRGFTLGDAIFESRAASVKDSQEKCRTPSAKTFAIIASDFPGPPKTMPSSKPAFCAATSSPTEVTSARTPCTRSSRAMAGSGFALKE